VCSSDLIAARVIVDGLRRLGGRPTRDGLIAALERSAARSGRPETRGLPLPRAKTGPFSLIAVSGALFASASALGAYARRMRPRSAAAPVPCPVRATHRG